MHLYSVTPNRRNAAYLWQGGQYRFVRRVEPLLLVAEENMPLLAAPVAAASHKPGTVFRFTVYSDFKWGAVRTVDAPKASARLRAGEKLVVRDMWEEPESEVA